MICEPDRLAEHIQRLVRPLAPARFLKLQRAYLARSIAELAHERLVRVEAEPLPDGRTQLRLPGDEAHVAWTCRARRRRLDFWHVEPDSIERWQHGELTRSDDAARFFLDLRATIGIEPFTLARFLEETAQTLYADACIHARGRPSAASLARADHQAIEAAMEGHPWILVNKGRMGFGAAEQQLLTPEAGGVQRLVWLAAHRDAARSHALAGTSYDELVARELGDEHAELRAQLAERGLDPDAYLFLPAHAWQLEHKLVVLFADEIAAGRLVPLAASQALYRPQQSIRTFQHAAAPERAYLKTSLSILNTGQIRGLAPEKLARAPRVTEWLRARLGGDPVLRELGTIVLGEIATASYAQPALTAIEGAPYQYRELLGVLFRESPLPHLAPGETLATMASLLHVDDQGRALVAAFAERAGLSLEVWLERYLRAYLAPLLHCFYHHELYFVAHGENTMLVLRDGAPARVVLKDLVEEIQVSRRVRAGLPAELAGLFYDIDDALVPLFILTDVVDGFFRYLADVLASHCGFAEDDFWRLVARTIRAYQQAHPGLAEAFARFDLFVPEFPRFCLNKYRLVLFGYAETANNALDTSPKFSGTLVNPLAGFSDEGV